MYVHWLVLICFNIVLYHVIMDTNKYFCVMCLNFFLRVKWLWLNNVEHYYMHSTDSVLGWVIIPDGCRQKAYDWNLADKVESVVLQFDYGVVCWHVVRGDCSWRDYIGNRSPRTPLWDHTHNMVADHQEIAFSEALVHPWKCINS